MAANDARTFTDAQLGDIRFAIDRFQDIQVERDTVVLSAEVQIAGKEIVRVRYDNSRSLFVVDV